MLSYNVVSKDMLSKLLRRHAHPDELTSPVSLLLDDVRGGHTHDVRGGCGLRAAWV